MSRKAIVWGLTVEVGMAEPASDVEDEPGKDEHSHTKPNPPVCNSISAVVVCSILYVFCVYFFVQLVQMYR